MKSMPKRPKELSISYMQPVSEDAGAARLRPDLGLAAHHHIAISGKRGISDADATAPSDWRLRDRAIS